MLKKFLILVIVAAAVVAGAVLRGVVGSNDVVLVDVEPLAKRSIQASVLASGRLAHEEKALLSTEEIGKVTAIYVEEGDRVKKGQLLLQIDDQRLKAVVEQDEASVRVQQIAIERQQMRTDNLHTQWDRKAELHEKGLLDDDSFDVATNDLGVAEIDLRSSREALLQAQAQLEQAQDRLSKTRVYSPIDGTVTSLDIKVGETAISSTTNVPGSSLMTIANPDSIHTEVNVDEADIANIEVGQKARVYAIAYPDQPLEGVIDSIAVSAKVAEGQQGRSFAVKIRFTDTGGIVLRPGMTCRAEIFTHVVDGILAVPIQAIFVEEDRARNETHYYVFVMRDGEAKRIEVEVGLSDDSYQEIVGGLDEGEQVIIGPDRALRNLEDGDAVALTTS